MDDAAFQQLLLREEDLKESFYGEEPSAAYDPAFVSGDSRAGHRRPHQHAHARQRPPSRDGAPASALFTNVVGSVVFHHVAQFGQGACRQILQELFDAVHACAQYRMELNDGVQLDISRVDLGPVELGNGGFLVRWLSTVDHFRIETAWVIVAKDDILTFVNVRVPDESEIHRLAHIAVDRVTEPTGVS
ncbi:hypothetical protein E4K10_46140 [Streptomyces sp. T1317-0309]|nr:hypothetical protein E4K10_46140 [Streptomyces sp. T1317-0309]